MTSNVRKACAVALLIWASSTGAQAEQGKPSGGAPRVTNTACGPGIVDDSTKLDIVHRETGGKTVVLATPGSATCKGTIGKRALGEVSCQVKGPATIAWDAGQDFQAYDVPRGRTATFTERGAARSDVRDGVLACFLNSLESSQRESRGDPRMNEPVPDEVVAQINEDALMCKEQGGKISGGEKYVRLADFNGDGKTDYLLVTGALRCSTAASLYCGQLGCPVTAYVSQPNGRYPASLNLSALEAEVKQVNGRDIVVAMGQTLAKQGLVPVTGRWAYSKGRWKKLR